MKFENFILSICFLLIPFIGSTQTYDLEWKDSIVSHCCNSIYLPKIVIHEQSESIYFVVTKGEVISDIALVKYDFQGNLIWESIIDYNFIDIIFDLQLDIDGNIYVQRRGWSLDKFTPEGQLSWHFEFGNSQGLARSFVIDENKNVYITDNSRLVKLDENGQLLWTKLYSVCAGWKLSITNNSLNILGLRDSGYCIINTTLDGDDLDYNEFVVDEFIIDNAIGDGEGGFYSGSWYESYQVNHVNFEGEVLWTYNFTPEADERPLRLHHVKQDKLGNTYAAGQIYSGSEHINILVTKIDASGDLLWETEFNNMGDSLPEIVNNLFVTDNSIFILGQTQNELDVRESFILNIDKEGNILNKIRLKSNIGVYTPALDMQVDANGNLFILGAGTLNDTMEFVEIYKYNPNTVGNKSITQNNKLKISPNPFKNKIQIEGSKGDLFIHNSLGQQVMKVENSEQISQIDLSGFVEGLYFLSNLQNNILFTQKIIKQ